ncbi:hypothetical protein DT065_09165 [Salicibibacter kimchii]|uniref:Uncharacterized protein n=1 Tax=Salicibibacter kimchii TaxID=2099786 RepID=A0A345BYZ1_9BACI|nr:hypothetical protein DT065_09165 [Salicibibacter kimchii]
MIPWECVVRRCGSEPCDLFSAIAPILDHWKPFYNLFSAVLSILERLKASYVLFLTYLPIAERVITDHDLISKGGIKTKSQTIREFFALKIKIKISKKIYENIKIM